MFLELSDLRADYGGHLALDGVSLTAAAGEILLVAGHNGAGKSTLLKSVIGTVGLLGGRVALEGRDLTRLPTEERLALGIALAPQGRGSFPNLTVAENLALAGSRGTVTRAPLAQRLEQVFHLFPALPAFRQRLAGRLSGGQQQMLAIGMTLMKQPRLLLLDEPSVGLAPRLVEEILELVARIRDEQHIATVLVEQNVGQASRICDRIVILNAGRVVKDLRPAELTDAILWESF
jgi:branched-chain amino acid transport system ATP-binding protein